MEKIPHAIFIDEPHLGRTARNGGLRLRQGKGGKLVENRVNLIERQIGAIFQEQGQARFVGSDAEMDSQVLGSIYLFELNGRQISAELGALSIRLSQAP